MANQLKSEKETDASISSHKTTNVCNNALKRCCLLQSHRFKQGSKMKNKECFQSKNKVTYTLLSHLQYTKISNRVTNPNRL